MFKHNGPVQENRACLNIESKTHQKTMAAVHGAILVRYEPIRLCWFEVFNPVHKISNGFLLVYVISLLRVCYLLSGLWEKYLVFFYQPLIIFNLSQDSLC